MGKAENIKAIAKEIFFLTAFFGISFSSGKNRDYGIGCALFYR
jgi:hypothetical protein